MKEEKKIFFNSTIFYDILILLFYEMFVSIGNTFMESKIKDKRDIGHLKMYVLSTPK